MTAPREDVAALMREAAEAIDLLDFHADLATRLRAAADAMAGDTARPVLFGGYVLRPNVNTPRDQMWFENERGEVVGVITGITSDAAMEAS